MRPAAHDDSHLSGLVFRPVVQACIPDGVANEIDEVFEDPPFISGTARQELDELVPGAIPAPDQIDVRWLRGVGVVGGLEIEVIRGTIGGRGPLGDVAALFAL